jgi:tRNA(fMet)-specific endonuclease VapC
MIVLDSDHLTHLMWTESAEARRLTARLDQLGDEKVTTTIVNYEEQTRGWLAYVKKSRNMVEQIAAYRRLKRHLEIFRTIPALDFDERSAIEFQNLKNQRTRVGTFDLKIAAVVLAHNATLLSRNLTDFKQIPNLRVEDWTL